MNNMDKDSMVYDMGYDTLPTSIPDPAPILDEIIKILEFMDQTDIQIMRKTEVAQFHALMEEKFSDFADKYYSVFMMVLSGEDLTPLFKMMEIMAEMNSGTKSIKKGEEDVGYYLTKFLPDSLLGSENKQKK